ncbi:MAG TPA: ATP-binding cassette domain-containing protein [Gammaproteobacteria bacterium]
MNAHVLELENVTKRFGDFTAVHDVSLTIPRGSTYGFLGPNGAGKTTTIRMIFDIIKPTSGRITILGARTALDVRPRIGYLPEEKGLYKTMTAAATVAYFATLKGIRRKAARKRAYELLERYGLGEFADAKIQALSKGMSQKVQVLCAIAHEPEFVILDEPFSGLDPVNQQVLEGLIRDLAQRGSTVVFSTHIMQHAERLCDRLFLIVKGRKVFDGTVAAAKATIPRRVLISTESSVEPLAKLDGVVEIKPLGESPARAGMKDWEIRLRERTSAQAILERCFESGIALHRFDHSEPSLHDAFVALVGQQEQA